MSSYSLRYLAFVLYSASVASSAWLLSLAVQHHLEQSWILLLASWLIAVFVLLLWSAHRLPLQEMECQP